MQVPKQPLNNRAWPLMRRLLRFTERCFALIGMLFVAYALFFDVTVIVSSSMSPTLKGANVSDGDWVLSERVSYHLRSPRRWDVVTYIRDDGARLMKRIAGLPGENIEQPRQGPLLINGQPVTMPTSVDLHFLRYGNLAADKPVPCGEGYYVLGDDTRDSDDSRFNAPIPRDRIVGRAWLIVWPLSRIGFVNS